MKKLFILFLLSVSWGSFLHAQVTDQEIFLQGERLWQEGRIDAALERYQNLLSQNPMSPLAPSAAWKNTLGLIRLSRNEEAGRTLEAALIRYPQLNNVQAQFWKSYLLLESKKLDLALAGLEKLTSFSAEIGADFWYHLGRARALAGQWETALSALETFKVQKGRSYLESPQPQLLLAQIYNRTGRQVLIPTLEVAETWPEDSKQRLIWEKAEAFWTLGNKPGAAELWNGLILGTGSLTVSAYIRLFQYYETEKKTQELGRILAGAKLRLQNQPGLLAELQTRLGILYYQTGRLPEALKLLEESVSIDSNSAAGLGGLYLVAELEKSSQGVKALELTASLLARKQEPQDLLLEKMASLSLKVENYPEALKYYSLLAPTQGIQASNRAFFRAYALAKMGQPRAALDLLDPTLKPKEKNLLLPWLSLQGQLENTLQLKPQAEETRKTLLLLDPSNPSIQIASISMALQKQDSREALNLLDSWDKAAPDLKTRNPGIYPQNRYLRSLALIGQKNFTRALSTLEDLLKISDFPKRSELLPYIYYYAGWSAFKLENSDTGKAFSYFSTLVKEFPKSEFIEKALYWGGWTAMSLKKWTEAETLFRQLMSSGKSQESLQAPLYLARCLEAQSKHNLALQAYLDLGRARPPGLWSAQALLEAALLKKTQNDLPGYLELLQETENRFPLSPQGEESLGKIVESAFDSKDWARTVSAAVQYRSHYPKGSGKDRVLHQSAAAQLALGQPYGAVLAWMELIENHKSSPFRGIALFETGQLYFTTGDYSLAKELWTRLKQEDPGTAATYNLDRRLQEVRLIQEGASETESKLKALVDLSTPEGRQAQVALARYYLLQGKQEEGKILLDQVQTKGDTQASASAQYWIGEYWFRRSQYKTAGEAFLKVLSYRSTDRDLTASSLYKAIQMTVLTKNPSQGRQILTALAANFPDSDWVVKAQELLEAKP